MIRGRDLNPLCVVRLMPQFWIRIVIFIITLFVFGYNGWIQFRDDTCGKLAGPAPQYTPALAAMLC